MCRKKGITRLGEIESGMDEWGINLIEGEANWVFSMTTYLMSLDSLGSIIAINNE